MPPRKLIFTNDTDWVVARDMDEVREILIQSYGTDDSEPDEWRCLEDDETVTIFDMDAKPVVRGGGTASDLGRHPSETKTAREWAGTAEPGILCSTEF